MAENLLIDLAQTVMIEKYGLDELEYSLVSFSEGSKTVSVKMSDGYIPVQAWFPRDFLRFEEMKRWDDAKKELYVRHAINNELEIPPQIQDAFHDIIMKVEMPTDNETGVKVEFGEGGGKAVVSLNQGDLKVESVENGTVVKEETADEFTEKLEGKKAKKPKLGKKLAKAK